MIKKIIIIIHVLKLFEQRNQYILKDIKDNMYIYIYIVKSKELEVKE